MSKSNYFYKNMLSNADLYKDAYFDLPSIGHLDPDSKANSLGYRSPEFGVVAEMLASGCSFTYGQGVTHKGTWPAQLASLLDVDCHNLGASGTGVGFQIGNIFSYIHKYGNPKIIVCLFPEFTRMRVVSNRNFMVPYNDKEKAYLRSDSDTIDYSYTYAGIHGIPAISKIPHLAEEVIPQELAINISINYIKMLEMYCNSNGIIFLWSTWHKEQHNYLRDHMSGMSFKNFIEIDVNKWHSEPMENYKDLFHEEGGDIWSEDNTRPKCTAYTDCHSELRSVYGKNFDYSDDITKCAPSHHWGAHRYRHVAEIFLKGIDEYHTRN